MSLAAFGIVLCLTASADPATPTVTLPPGARPVDEILADISRQTGANLDWGGGPIPSVSVPADKAPFIVALAELCKRTGCGFSSWQTLSKGESMRVSPTDFPVRAYACEGPLLLVWHGLWTTSDHTFDDPKKPLRATKYRLGIFVDPKSHAEPGDGKRALRDMPVTFTVGGKALELRSDHRPNVFGMGPEWEFLPRPELSGTSATVEIKIPYLAPSRIGEAKLPWASSGEAKSEGCVLTLQKVESAKEQDQDPEDPFKQIDVLQLTATFRLVHPGARACEEARKAKRQPSAEEGALFAKACEGEGVLAAHEASLLGAGGEVLKAALKRADGMHGPPMGYTFKAGFKTPKLDFQPKELRISWAEGFTRREATLRIENAPLGP